MNVTPMGIYLLTRCNAIVFVCIILTLAFFVVSIVFFILYIDDRNLYHNDDKCYRNCLIVSSLLFVASMLASALIPTTKEMAAIVVIPKIANSETVKGLGNDIVSLAKEWIVELKPEKKGKEK